MKYTLLDYVQYIASSLESDAISSINDSIESQQIAKVVRTAYYDLISRQNMPEHYSLFNLTASTDTTKPTLMFLPSTMSNVLEVKYDTRTINDTFPQYTTIKFLPRVDFFTMLHEFNPSSEPNVGSFTYVTGGNSLTFFYKSNIAPTYYTTFDDSTLVFDSYDVQVDSVLSSTKSWCWGRRIINWTMADAFVPELDEPQTQLLMNEAKALAWAEMKQSTHGKAEQNAKRLLNRSQRTKIAADAESDFDKLPYFGRK